MNRHTFLRAAFQGIAAFAIAISPPAFAGEAPFPNRPIRVVVPFPAGGLGDLMARILVDKLKPALKVPITIDNKAGGGTVIGTDAVVQAAADGYTWLTASTPHTSNVTFMAGNRHDPLRDLLPVATFGIGVNALAVPASSPATTVEQFVAMARRQSDKLLYGSSGVGSSQFLSFELLKRATGIKADPVHYKGAPPILADLAAGQLAASFLPVSVAQEQARSGRIRILAIASRERLATLPDVPTLAQAGYPEAAVAPWLGIMVPAQTPPEIVARIEAEIRAAVAAPDVKDRFLAIGAMPTFLGASDSRTMIGQEIETWRALAQAIGFKAE